MINVVDTMEQRFTSLDPHIEMRIATDEGTLLRPCVVAEASKVRFSDGPHLTLVFCLQGRLAPHAIRETPCSLHFTHVRQTDMLEAAYLDPSERRCLRVASPAFGLLYCGYSGSGRMRET